MYGMNSDTQYQVSMHDDMDLHRQIAVLRRKKLMISSDFTSSLFSLTCMISERLAEETIVKKVQSMISVQVRAVAIMVELSQVYEEKKDVVEMEQLGKEMAHIETDFRSIISRVNEYINHSTGVNVNIRDTCTPQRVSAGIRTVNEVKGKEDHDRISEDVKHLEKQVCEIQQRLTETEKVEYSSKNADKQKLVSEHKNKFNGLGIEEEAEPFRNRTHTASIGVDMWSQLKRISIPTFSGDKNIYESWKSAFMQCIDRAAATPEYKLLQLRQCLEGKALQCIQELGHSPAAYEAAKSVLERKFGGKRRQIAKYLEKIENYKPMHEGSAQEMEAFADLLEIAVQNLKEAGRHLELGDGSLFALLQKKLTTELVTDFNRWLHVNSKDGTVETLLEWVMRESEFRVIGTEAVNGVSSRAGALGMDRSDHAGTGYSNGCVICHGSHDIVDCNIFEQMAVHERWDMARKFKLCFRCLGNSHFGQACPQTRQCRVDECSLNHHRLLHRSQQQ